MSLLTQRRRKRCPARLLTYIYLDFAELYKHHRKNFDQEVHIGNEMFKMWIGSSGKAGSSEIIMECPECGWKAVTTCMSEKEDDLTRYSITILGDEKRGHQ